MYVYGEDFVSGLSDGPISRPEESYHVCVCVCVRERESYWLHVQWVDRKRQNKKEREKVTSGETVGMHKKEIRTLAAADLFEASDVQQTELCVWT